MKRKLRRILLVDDNPADNFLHERVIRKLDCAEHIDVCETGMEALDFLKSRIDGVHPQPDLIFLDINMPGMNGWEFLEAHRELPEATCSRTVIAMLTVSLNPVDAERAGRYSALSSYANKPLTVDMLRNLLEEHFPELFDD